MTIAHSLNTNRTALFFVQLAFFLLAAFSNAFAAQPEQPIPSSERFIGVWLSSSRPELLSVTELKGDQTFHTDRYAGIEADGALDGRWQVRGNSLQWWYDALPSAEEDINPILSVSRDRFSLREKDGAISNFFRKGSVDPHASEFLPIRLGAGWVLKDSDGEMAIRISVRETFAGKDCYRVDWVAGFVYQSEYWQVTEEGLFAVGRSLLGRTITFNQPYLLLKRQLKAGDSWEAGVSFDSFSDLLKFTVGSEEEVETPAGRFRAFPVTMRGKGVAYKRWYAKGVGLVREDSLLPGDLPLNEKKLSRRIE